ncbi:MAG: M56 family metallopeptidase, partial [Brevundimonas sp.]
GVSAATSEALLAHLGRAQLILPVGLTDGAAAVAASAVIAHELAHLKRGDHHALWMEEALLALLAVNPLMPMLRARRAAAREEVCDALALADAAPEARRAYARSLIEALRDRAGPQASGGLPALTFTGAGRTTAMSRLKAVLNPATAAGRGPRLVAFGVAGVIAALAGAGSLAVAAERAAVIPTPATPATAPVPLDEQPTTVVPGAGARTLLNGEPLPEGLPMWAVAPKRIEVRTLPAGSGEVDFILPFTGSTPVSVDGRRMPAGFPANGVNPDAVARVDVVGDHVMYTLKPETEVRRAPATTEGGNRAAIAATEVARDALSSEQRARYRNPTARQYQVLCASRDPGDEGFCAGVMFAQLGSAPANGVCPPAALEQGDEAARRVALGTLVERGMAEIARGPIRAGDTASDVARSALARAYPCDAAQAEAFRAAATRVLDSVPLTVIADIDGRPLSVQGDETLRVVLTDENGAVMNTFGTLNPGKRASGPLGPLGMAIAADDFPGAGESTRTYTLTGEIRGPGRALRYIAEPVTIRLAPGARRTDLRPTLSFRPA